MNHPKEQIVTEQDVERVARHNERREREYEASDLIRLLTSLRA